MKKSFLGSASLHALIVIAALLGLPGMRPPEIKPVEAIQVDISNITNETKLKAQSTSEEKPVEKPKPKVSQAIEKTKPKEKVTEEKKLAAVEPAEQEPPPPEPKKEPEKKVEDTPLDPDPLKELLKEEEQKLEEQKKAEEAKQKKEEEKKKKAEEKKKKEEEKKKKAAEEQKKLEESMKKRKLDTAALDDLLNKENEEASSTLEQKSETGTPEKSAKNVQGEDAELAATLIDALRQRLSECWTVPPGAREAAITVKVQFNLSPDGRVQGLPIVIGGGGGDALSAATAQSAISAVMECQSYDFLPKDRYDMWQEITVNFTPDMMSG